MAAMTLGAADTVLCSGTLGWEIPFRERVAAAAAGGFTGLSLWGRDHQDARDEGLSDPDIRPLLADHGLSVAELDPAWWWLPARPRSGFRPSSTGSASSPSARTALRHRRRRGGPLAQRGRRVRGHVVARRRGGSLRRAVRPGGRARARGAPRVPAVVADPRPGDGLAGGPRRRPAQRRSHARRLALLPGHTRRRLPRSIPAASILGVQLCDAPAVAEADPLQATLHERLLPGDGELDAALLRPISGGRRVAPIGVEVSPTRCTRACREGRAGGRRIRSGVSSAAARAGSAGRGSLSREVSRRQPKTGPHCR